MEKPIDSHERQLELETTKPSSTRRIAETVVGALIAYASVKIGANFVYEPIVHEPMPADMQIALAASIATGIALNRSATEQ